MNSSTASSHLRSLIAAAIFGALASSFGAAFAAGADSDPVSVNVRYSDLNLSSPQGALVLYNRIQMAAENACSYWWFRTDADENRCVHDAIANTVTKVNHPALFAVYNAKNKAPLPGTLVSQSR
jgi:UrcA family protein